MNMETRIIAPAVAVLVLYAVVCLRDRGTAGLVLILRFADQEEAVEGFLRKVAWWAGCTGARVELVVLVDSSRDLTETIVRRLARDLGFHVPPDGCPQEPRVGTRCFDARRLTGSQLARVPLANLLTA